MLNYLVIGICLALLIVVIYFSIKPISMGIEARRNLKDTTPEDINEISNNSQEKFENENLDKNLWDGKTLKIIESPNQNIHMEKPMIEKTKKLNVSLRARLA